MAEIVPFKGVFYDVDRMREPLERVVAPPYDVISPDDQETLYATSPHNFIRIILNRSETGDDGATSYIRAAYCLNDWLNAGILKEESCPALYVYRQEFTNPADSERYTRTGLVCALKLEP